MFSALLIIISMSFLDVHKFRGFQYKPLNKIVFYIFIVIFLSLLRLGAKHVESPYIELGQIFTSLYFMYFLVFIPFFNLLEYYLEYYLDFKNLTIVPSPHAFVNLPQKQSIIPSYFQLRFLAHISKFSSIYAFFISMFVIMIFKLNFDSTYIVYAMDNDNQSTETTQQNNPAINVTQEQADKLTELQKEYDNLAKELDTYYKKIGKISYVDVEDAVNQINEAKEEGDKLVIAKHQAATALFNYKELLKSISK
jgi:ubiquinol-cytochrome c reductase cytochrome b subunit